MNHAAELAPRRLMAIGVGLALLVTGCPDDTNVQTPSDTAPPPVVRILVLKDDALADAIRREWTASGRGELDLTVASPNSIAEAKRLPADCIIYPSAMLGELVERKLVVPLPEASVTGAAMNRGDIFPLVRRHETTFGGDVYAVPFGSPALVLLYRRDVLERLGQEPPRTWREYDELVRLIAESEAIADLAGVGREDWHAAVEPLGGHWAAEMLLARAAGYARRSNDVSGLFHYETMEPLIDRPPFLRAMRELTAAQQLSPDAALAMTPADARRELLAGKCAMAITWPARDVGEVEVLNGISIGCAALPGAVDVYNPAKDAWETSEGPSRVALLGIAGRLGSVTSSARHSRAAADALVWLAGADKGNLIAANSNACSPCRSSQIRQADAWVSRDFGGGVANEYAMILQAEKSRPLWLFTPRIPGRERYLSALDAAVKTALIGENTPEVALDDAADQWRQITEELELDEQKAAYNRSLGLGR